MTAETRVGIGYDSHRFAGARTLILGGVTFPGEPGLEGHSDADVLTHAVTDAVIGAAGLGDIGRHFPDDDPRFAGADSIALLGQAVSMIAEAGWRVVNVDATLICERPRLAPHAAQMAERLGGALDVDRGCVNVKATTNEGMGFIGRGEGIAAVAVAMLVRRTGDSVAGEAGVGGSHDF
jgi:2-C-methyl-D-erythritol 2,4-cyclodiphosphate synthase